MLKSFNSLLIDKAQCVSSGNILPEFFFQPTVRAGICFWHDGLVQECTCRIFFFKITQPPPPPPPPSEVEWSAPKERLAGLDWTGLVKLGLVKRGLVKIKCVNTSHY